MVTPARLVRLVGLFSAVVFVVLCVFVPEASAQSAEDLRRLQSLTPAQRAQLMERLQAGEAGTGEAAEADEPGRSSLPVAPEVVLPMSRIATVDSLADSPGALPLEAIEFDLFGADFFRGDPGQFGPRDFGPVPSDYLIGPGDEITVDVWGEVEFRHERIVDRDGSIILPRGGRIMAANRKLTDVTRSIRRALSRSYSGIDSEGSGGTTFVEVSLGRLRAIRVFVVGEVQRPGAYDLRGVSTAFSALFAAGGPNEEGSLREIRLMRGVEEVGAVDLYAYLLQGVREGDLILRDGDTVFVPPRRVTVSIEGAVRRPNRYEMLDGEGVRDLVGFAGGFASDAVTERVHVERVLPGYQRRDGQPDRVQRDLELDESANPAVLDGDRMFVAAVSPRLDNVVEITGNVKVPGRYEFREGETVSELIARAGGLWDDTFTERASLDRVEVDGRLRSVDVELGGILAGAATDPILRPRDVLTIYANDDLMDPLLVTIAGEVRSAQEFDWREGMTLRDAILKAGGIKLSADLLRAEIARLRVEALEIRDGSVPPELTVDVIQVKLGEDWLTTTERFELMPFDRVDVRRLPWWELQRTVTVRGEVLYPGQYALSHPGERLSSVIDRAGGLKPGAYPTGARLVRAQDAIGNVALDLERAIEDPGSADDVILERGDEIVIPPQPYTVKVTGAVNFPTSVVWKNGVGLADYVSRAGGYSEDADEGRTHVVYANGESKPIRRWWWDPEVRPGSTVVVPTEAPRDGPNRLETLREISAIVASVATVWLVIDRTN